MRANHGSTQETKMNAQAPVTLAPTTIVATDAAMLTNRSIAFLTQLYNNLSAKMKGPSLTLTHKLPKAQLVQKIIRLQADIAKANTTVVKPAIANGAYDKKRNGPKLNKKISKTRAANKVAREVAKAKPRNDELSKYIASKDLTPKQARSKFRRAKVKKVGGHYVFNAETKKALA